MKLYFTVLILFIVIPQVSYSQNYDVDNLRHTKLDFVLLSTIIQEPGKSKAIIKYLTSSELKTFELGEHIDLIEGYKFRILDIMPCLVVFDIYGYTEKLECKRNDFQQITFRDDTLSSYKIIPPRFLILKNKFTDVFDDEILSACTKHDVDPNLVKALIKAESNFDQFAVSHKNAEGLMQLMPATAKSLGVSDPYSVRDNVFGGTKYLASLLERFERDLTQFAIV